jgi:CRISPR-associated protein Csd1
MLLKALHDFAHQRKLLDDLAFSPKAVRWIIELDENGNLLGGGPSPAGDDKRGKEFLCPRLLSDSNSGTIAGFLVEAVDGMFSLSPNPQKPKNPGKLAAKTEHFWQQLRDCQKATGNRQLNAVLKFRDSIGDGVPFLTPTSGGHILFTASGQEAKVINDEFTFSVEGKLIVEIPDLVAYWSNVFGESQQQAESGDSDDDEEDTDGSVTEAAHGICLVSGEFAKLARTHVPKIRGVPGAQGSGAKIVSFDKSSRSYSSYGFNQSYNAPVSEAAAIAYCVALDWLIKKSDFHSKVSVRKDGKEIGIVTCFWAKHTEEAGSIFARLLDRPQPAAVKKFLKTPWSGIEQEVAKKDQFNVVTLTGNSGRIVVKRWLQESLETAVKNLRQWFEDLDLEVPPRPEAKPKKGKPKAEAKEYNPLSVYWLSCATVREAKDLKAETPASLYAAALEGTAPPISLIKPLLDQLQSKILTDENYRVIWDQSRFALLKLIINRHHRSSNETTMQLESKLTTDTPDPAYNCGRLLSVFDNLQRTAHRAEAGGASKLNTSLAERYFGAAASNPNGAFSLMWRLHMHHLKKIRQKGEPGRKKAAAFQMSIRDICRYFKASTKDGSPQFPRVFTLVQQGRFALGYYQQEAERAEQVRLWMERNRAEGKLPPDADEQELDLLSDDEDQN